MLKPRYSITVHHFRAALSIVRLLSMYTSMLKSFHPWNCNPDLFLLTFHFFFWCGIILSYVFLSIENSHDIFNMHMHIFISLSKPGCRRTSVGLPWEPLRYGFFLGWTVVHWKKDALLWNQEKQDEWFVLVCSLLYWKEKWRCIRNYHIAFHHSQSGSMDLVFSVKSANIGSL